jgi:hypothetical protein
MSDVLLDEAERFVLDIWNKQGRLVRQAVFWDRKGVITMAAFSSPATREASLQELRKSANDTAPTRVFFFSESSAVKPNGEKIDIIVLEVGDGPSAFYGQRIYTAEKQPRLAADSSSRLDESPFAGLVVAG